MIDIDRNPMFLNKFLDYQSVTLNKSPNSVKEYNYDLVRFLKYISYKKKLTDKKNFDEIEIHDFSLEALDSITEDDIQSYLFFMANNYESKPATISRKASTIRIFFKFLHKRKFISNNPALDIETPKREKRLPKYLSLAESEKLLTTINDDEKDRNKPRDFAIITVFLNCGIRLSELVGINISNIDFTENKMTVAKVFCDMREFSVSGNGYRIAGDIKYQDSAVNPMSTKSLSEILKCCVLCNNAVISSEHEVSSRERGSLKNNGFWKAVGDPTETALLVMAAKGNVTADKLKYDCIRINEIPFDSQSRCMTVIVSEKSGQKTAFSKGASDVILEKCSFIYTDNGIIPLTSSVKRQIQNKVDEMSENALRVLAFAEKTSYQNGEPSGMVFLGLTGMIDPLREEAKIAVRKCTKAHIRTVMITGDHKNTAAAIARQAGILKGKKVMTGEELNRLSDAELLECIDDISVFARVEPCHKLRLVKAYKKKGHIVTMTGDGVNDAPAIKEADVGVAMGITGTDVTKQSADIILLDDNFATLVQAVEQGRGIYANIRKFVRYLLSCNIGEVITMFAGILMGLPLVMLPVQLLLVNLITEGLPAIALGMEPTDSRVMNRPPRKSDESFFSDGLMFRIVFRGIMIGLCTLGCFTAIIGTGADIAAARTCALLTLVMSQLIHVFECKSEKGNIFTVPYFNNKKLLLAVLFSSAIIVSAIWFPPLQAIFATAALSGKEVLVSLAFSFAIPLINCIFYHGD